MILDKINMLNDAQKEATLKIDGPILILAGAGSGKTRVLTHKIAYLLHEGIRAYNILAITFTNKASSEMRERAIALDENAKGVLISTFHSACVRILRADIDKIGYGKNFTIYDSDDSKKVIRDIMREFKINDKMIDESTIIRTISSQKDKLIDADAYDLKVEGNKENTIAQIYKEYERVLKTNNALDFDDIILKTVQLFQKDEDVLLKYQEKFKYILVDEYQDTSKSQYTFISLLSQKYKNLCVVGDDDQSIYSFRGADIANILNFEKEFKDVTTIKLLQNYRSDKSILETANYIIKNNSSRKDKKLWTNNADGEPIVYETLSSDKEEADYVVAKINEYKDKGYEYSDFAVLYRTNVIGRMIEEKLNIASIPYKIYGGINFYARKEIKDVISYLKIMDNPSDDVAFKRIINAPKRGIGDTTIRKIQEFAQKNELHMLESLSRVDEIDVNTSIKTKLKDFYSLINEIKENKNTMKVYEFTDYVLEISGYRYELEEDGNIDSAKRLENLTEFLNKAREYDLIGGGNITLFLEDVALISDIITEDEITDFVALMTIHSSKGLEFRVVFLIGFENGVFPGNKVLKEYSLTELEEERRLLYVAITRAKERLYITNSRKRMQFGKVTQMVQSLFVKEFPQDTLQTNILKKKSTYRQMPSYKPNLKHIQKSKISVGENVSIDFEVNDTITHFKFGSGKVIKISPAGADYEVVIEFDKVGKKTLMANLSKLSKI